MWKSAAQRLVFDLSDGLAVRLLGRLTVYSPRGEYQIIVDAIEPEGVGAQELAFRQLFARLSAEGLFDPDRKRPLPRYPRRIAIVTSPTGAAVRDLLQVTGRRWNGTDVLIVPTRVQGAGAGKRDRRRDRAGELAPGVRVVIVVARRRQSPKTSGAFNDEAVVRAIAGSRVPVVSAVGHEIDVTLADLAADRRALTPSEAGELVVPDAAEVAMHLDRLAQRLHRASEIRLRDARARLDQLRQRTSDRDRPRPRPTAAIASTASPPRSKPSTPRPSWPEATASPSWPTAAPSSAPPTRSSPGDLIQTRLRAGQITSRVVQQETKDDG